MLKSVCTALTAVRLQKGRASLVINCSYDLHFAQDLHDFLSCCDSLRKENRLYSLLSLQKNVCFLFDDISTRL